MPEGVLSAVLGRPCAPTLLVITHAHAPRFGSNISTFVSFYVHGETWGQFCRADLEDCRRVGGAFLAVAFLGQVGSPAAPVAALEVRWLCAHGGTPIVLEMHLSEHWASVQAWGPS